MQPLTIIESPYATLWYHPGPGIVHHQIHKFISGQAFRDLLLTGLEVLQKNRAQKWLSDDRANAVLRPEDVDWSHQFWFPQTVQAGWKYWAIVQPDKVVGQVTMKGLASEYGRINPSASPLKAKCNGAAAFKSGAVLKVPMMLAFAGFVALMKR